MTPWLILFQGALIVTAMCAIVRLAAGSRDRLEEERGYWEWKGEVWRRESINDWRRKGGLVEWEIPDQRPGFLGDGGSAF